MRRQRFDKISVREKTINPELFKYHFHYLTPRKEHVQITE